MALFRADNSKSVHVHVYDEESKVYGITKFYAAVEVTICISRWLFDTS